MMVTETQIRIASLNWWRTKRPLKFSHEEHLGNSTVNCVGPAERDLARSVAGFIKAREQQEV